jgi:hypothetical protein
MNRVKLVKIVTSIICIIVLIIISLIIAFFIRARQVIGKGDAGE